MYPALLSTLPDACKHVRLLPLRLLLLPAALMQDQVAALQATGVPADYLSSTRTAAERRAILDQLSPSAAAAAAAAAAADGGSSGGSSRLALLYVTPELIATEG